MAALMRAESKELLLANMKIAKSMYSRTKGLLGTDGLADDEALWIHRCNSIHTFFMRYAIDCVFLDRNLEVKSIVPAVKPGRIVWPKWSAVSVIEMRAGRAEELKIRKGDRLYVGI